MDFERLLQRSSMLFLIIVLCWHGEKLACSPQILSQSLQGPMQIQGVSEEVSFLSKNPTVSFCSAGLVDTKELLISPGKAAWIAYLVRFCMVVQFSMLWSLPGQSRDLSLVQQPACSLEAPLEIHVCCFPCDYPHQQGFSIIKTCEETVSLAIDA